MTTPSPLADACPECFPGDFPPVAPSAVIPDGGSLCAFYEHAVCGRTWACWWDPGALDWPLAEPRRAA